MLFEEKKIILKDGREAVLRSPVKEDAAELLAYLRDCAGETEFILRTPEECQRMTLQIEENFIESVNNSGTNMLISCFIGDTAAGNCQLSYNSAEKIAHRADIAIGVREKFWNLGIGSVMFREMIADAEKRGIVQLELEYIDGNDRAKHLYEKMGFTEVGQIPDAFKMKDGSFRNEVIMVRKMK